MVFEAVLDAGFDETCFQLLEVGLSEEELGVVRSFYDHFLGLLEGVAWAELGRNEFLYTRAMRRAGGRDMSDLQLWGMRVDSGSREDVHTGLRDLLEGGHSARAIRYLLLSAHYRKQLKEFDTTRPRLYDENGISTANEDDKD